MWGSLSASSTQSLDLSLLKSDTFFVKHGICSFLYPPIPLPTNSFTYKYSGGRGNYVTPAHLLPGRKLHCSGALFLIKESPSKVYPVPNYPSLQPTVPFLEKAIDGLEGAYLSTFFSWWYSCKSLKRQFFPLPLK